MKMAKFKIWMVALTLIMGVSLTSCFNSDNDPIVTGFAYGKCTDFFPPTFQLFNGQKLVVSGSEITTTVNPGDVYGFYYQFDSEQQSPTAATINVTLYNKIQPVSINAKSSEGPTSESVTANSALYAFYGNVVFSNSTVNIDPAVVFDNEYLLLTSVYWVKQESADKQEEEFAKHAFVLTYDMENIKQGDTDLVLTLNHVITESSEETVTRNVYTSATKAYKLTYALAAFQSKAGQKPTTIKIRGQVNTSKNSLDGSTEQMWSYTLK